MWRSTRYRKICEEARFWKVQFMICEFISARRFLSLAMATYISLDIVPISHAEDAPSQAPFW